MHVNKINPLPKPNMSMRNRTFIKYWDVRYPIFQNTVARGKYQKIIKHLKFNEYLSQSQRTQADKFRFITEMRYAFIDYCQKCYVPNFNLSIDDQLFPCKTHCSLHTVHS